MADTLTPLHFDRMEALELTCYGPEFITPAAESYRLYRRFPYTTVAALAGEEIAGFVNLFPVKEPIFEALLQGEYNDHDMETDAVVDLAAHAGEKLEMFLSCVVAAPAFRGSSLVPALLQAAITPYLPYLRYCNRVITDNVTPAGERFSQRYGFRCLGSSSHSSSIYIQPFADFVRRAATTAAPKATN
jgi:hypothetical protein